MKVPVPPRPARRLFNTTQTTSNPDLYSTGYMRQKPDITDHTARVLIVDDERHNRDLLELMLAPEGYLLQTAHSGDAALAKVAERAPDLILLDVMMPGMDGYKVAARIKGDPATSAIPVIMVTALDDREARMLGLTAGAEDFLSKPIDRAELCVRVRNLLRLKAYSDYFDNYSRMLEAEVGSRTAELVESERLYRETFDEAPVGIVHVGLDGRWLRVNKRLCLLLGYSSDELRNPARQSLLNVDEAPDEADLYRQMAAGTLDRHVVDEKRYRCRDGSFIWVRVNMSVHRDATGQLRHFIWVVEDITERRALEAQIRQAGKMDAIGRLASGVAHDFNNLLSVILGFAEFVAADKAIQGQHREDLREIVKAATSAGGLTRQLLAFGRQQVLRTAPVDVNGLITNMTAMLGRIIGDSIKVQLALAADLAPALADVGQMEQVVMNLVVNARDAMPDGGVITIATKNIEFNESSLDEEPILPGRYTQLAVTDTGTGMSKETERHLFEPFFTTKDVGRGTGLGLSTTYGIVKQSNGHIQVRSELGHGTTFDVYLPCAGRDPHAAYNAMVSA